MLERVERRAFSKHPAGKNTRDAAAAAFVDLQKGAAQPGLPWRSGFASSEADAQRAKVEPLARASLEDALLPGPLVDGRDLGNALGIGRYSARRNRPPWRLFHRWRLCRGWRRNQHRNKTISQHQRCYHPRHCQSCRRCRYG